MSANADLKTVFLLIFGLNGHRFNLENNFASKDLT
jgi:hypothetical protein